MLRNTFALFVSVIVLSACQNSPASKAKNELSERLQRTIEIAHEPQNPYILVEAHRGSLALDRPENSVVAIEHAIEIGVDWVELDVHITADNQLVLVHDDTLDRTTTLSGRVDSYSLAEISAAKLVREDGAITDQHPPSLFEALDLMAGRMLFRLDIKCGDACVEQAYRMVKDKGMMNHAVYTETTRLNALAAGLTDEDIIVVGEKIEVIAHPDLIAEGVDYVQVKDFEADQPPLELMSAFAPFVRMVVYPYSDLRSGGRGDARSAVHPDDGWGWLAGIGGDIFLTDRPEALIEYLDLRGLRNRVPIEPATPNISRRGSAK